MDFKIWNQYHNPYYYWWRVRKWFKRPRWHLAYHGNEPTWMYGMYIKKEYYKRFFDFQIKGLGWKTKWGDNQHEWDPMIILTLFRKYQWVWVLNYVSENDPESSTRSMATWEAILDMGCKNHKPIADTIRFHTWTRYTKSDDKIYITIDKNIRSYE